MKKATTPPKQGKPPKEVIDFDALWKDFISYFLEETIRATMPDLWAAVDWRVLPVFLEQEFINALRGKFKIKDKRKNCDKLAKLRLLTGEDHYIFFHGEVQHQLEAIFSRRMFTYKSLAFLRYNTEEFTALAIFIAQPPDAEHKVYQHEKFGTKTTYKFNTYTIANQDEATLAASDNLFDLAVLAAKYTLDTEGDELKRLQFKRRLFELTNLKTNIPIEKIQKLLTFVDEYMHLKPEMENEFRASTPYFESFKSDTKMYTTWRSRQMANDWAKHATGKTFDELEAELAKSKEAEAQKEEALAEKEAEKEAEKVKTVLSISDKTDFSAEKIADVLGYDLAFVKTTLATKGQ